MVKIEKNKRSSTISRNKNKKGKKKKKKKNQSVKKIAENMTVKEIKELMKFRSRQAMEREEQLKLETIANNARKKKRNTLISQKFGISSPIAPQMKFKQA
ncbi:hypothetical protein AQUCO_01000418v1 [Aquilegia coerulea]|uniref:GAE domain-containing protein n=1 Tax=Aquilegia coerulea TaxID=218851 RepID=A0A2G5E9V2_AQUCA|nr:hypothetical protein AQUCO_01000418v1 [Aquilegia coerulea]